MTKPRITTAQAAQVARKKLPLRTESAIRSRLKAFTDDLAEAYLLGAEEAQREIVARFEAFRTAAPAPSDAELAVRLLRAADTAEAKEPTDG